MLSVITGFFSLTKTVIACGTGLIVVAAAAAAFTKPTEESLHRYAAQWHGQNFMVAAANRRLSPIAYQDCIVCRIAEEQEGNKYVGIYGAWFKL